MKLKAILLILWYLVLASGCVSYESLVNYRQGASMPSRDEISFPPDIRILPNDVLDIKVHTIDMETAAPFNLNAGGSNVFWTGDPRTLQLNGYLVDEEGNINFPVLGTVKIRDKTITEAENLLLQRLRQYLTDPVITIRLINFQVTVSGEVNTPGALNIYNNRITLPEAIAMAGDFTDHANRQNILLIRESDGARTYHRINMLRTDLFQTDHYYLKQNDMIYVEPLKAKIGVVGDQVNEIFTFVGVVAGVAALLIAVF